ncbi:hypothetical protein Btru_061653 [Bulinus truncatus]|nr:hypothetical protein Btru_061653 [Bulinus truncatus]
MNMLQGRKLVKAALAICIGTLVVNFMYVSLMRKRTVSTSDFQISAQESLVPLTDRQERPNQPYNLHMVINRSSEANTSYSDQKENSTYYKVQNFTNKLFFKKRVGEKNSDQVRKTETFHLPTSTASSEKMSQQNSSAKENQETLIGTAREGQGSGHPLEVKVHRMSPEEKKKIVDKVDEFHEDVLNNEILKLDDNNLTSAGNKSNCPDHSPHLLPVALKCFRLAAHRKAYLAYAAHCEASSVYAAHCEACSVYAAHCEACSVYATHYEACSRPT